MDSASDAEAPVRTVKPTKRKTAAEIRRINKEKRRQARDGYEQTQQAAHAYLHQYSTARATWKFNKARQIWLVKHIYLEDKVPDHIFPQLLDYLANAGDSFKQVLIRDAKLVAYPITATTEELRAQRKKVLGLMSSEPKKRVQRNGKPRKTVEPEPAKEEQDDEEKDEENKEKEEGGEPAAQQPAASADDLDTPQSVIDRALNVIEVLSKPVELPSKKSKKSKKSKSDDSLENTADKDAEKKEKKEKKAKKDKKSKKRKSSEMDHQDMMDVDSEHETSTKSDSDENEDKKSKKLKKEKADKKDKKDKSDKKEKSDKKKVKKSKDTN
ncbi:hypothetical protein LPJ73_005089 [Coemansia sp. RSA 2703]|nr:hypothetical protein LPJ73_005089 [Coemansia sp. RSA 2703]